MPPTTLPTIHLPTIFFDTNPGSLPIAPIQQSQNHQFQEEVYPGNSVNNHKSESHAGSHEVCELNGSCGGTVDLRKVATHMSKHHLQQGWHGASRLTCQWRGCQLPKPIRRDTIVSHIREKHLGQSRCGLQVISDGGV